jgi:hypothetical protein
MNSTSSITNCPNCNGDLTFNPGEQLLDCAFCKSSFNLKGEAVKTDTVINQAPELIIPFAFGNDAFNKSALEWLSQGDYTPADILDSFNNHVTKGIYIPLYIWQISYIITSPAGSKTDGTVAINIADGQKPWPADLIEFAKTSVSAKGQLKAFDKAYTLGFDVQEEDIADVNEFYKKAKQFALEAVVKRNNLQDGKNIVINEMGLTKVYAPFWINKYSYNAQNFEVIMSGSDVTKMGGTRPIDEKVQKATKPTFKPAFIVLLASIIILWVSVIVIANKPDNYNWLLKATSFIGASLMVFVSPIMIVITFIRRMSWTNPAIKLEKEREQKLAQRLAQRV